MYAIAKAAPALLGGISVLDERPELMLEVEAYVREEQRAEAEEEARQAARQRRESRARH